MALTRIETLTAYTSGETNIHQALIDGEQVVVTLINESGGAGTITGLSKSTTTATQNSAGNLVPTGETIADKQTIEIRPVIMSTDFEFLVLNATVALTCRVEGWANS